MSLSPRAVILHQCRIYHEIALYNPFRDSPSQENEKRLSMAFLCISPISWPVSAHFDFLGWYSITGRAQALDLDRELRLEALPLMWFGCALESII